MTTENNKLIAEFLEFNLTTDGIQTLYYDKQNSLKALPKFHNDWNWLMQVVEKIEKLGFNSKIESLEHTRVSIGDGKLNTLIQVDKETKIDAVYNACVTFIEWYNEQTAEKK